MALATLIPIVIAAVVVFLIAAVLKKRLHIWNEFFESVYEQAQI